MKYAVFHAHDMPIDTMRHDACFNAYFTLVVDTLPTLHHLQ